MASTRTDSTAAARLPPALVAVVPWVGALALTSLAWWLTLPLAAWSLGAHPRWWAPLAAGALLRQAVLPGLRGVAAARVRPRVTAFVAARCLATGSFEAEPSSVAPIAHRVEHALLDAAPTLVSATLTTAAFALVAAGNLPAAWVPATAVACVLAVIVRLVARRALTRSADRLLDAVRAEAAHLHAAARGRWEITGDARRRFLDATRATADAVVAAEHAHHGHLRVVRSAQLALFLAPLAWVLLARARSGVAVTLRDHALVLPAIAPALSALRAFDELALAWRAFTRLSATGSDVSAPTRTLPDGSIEVRDVSVRYGDRVALASVTLTIPARGVTAVVGPNGAGKSTLARVLSGSLCPDEGTCVVGGVALSDVAPEQVAFVPQTPCLMENLGVGDNLRLVAPACDDAAATRALHALGLRVSMDHPTAALSRGQQRRVAIARALLRAPKLLVLDEPDAWLDQEGRDALRDALRDAALETAVVLVTHRADLVGWVDRVVVLSARHTVEAEGEPREALAGTETGRALLAAMADESLRFAGGA